MLETGGIAVNWANKVALVTGATSGIGRATAMEFARRGAAVVAVGRDLERGRRVEADIAREGGQGLFVRADVSRATDVQAMVERAVQVFGGLDAACNAAASPGSLRPLADASEADYDATMAVDLRSVWLCLKYEIQAMRRQGRGAIVNVSSVNAVRPAPEAALYSAAKAAVVSLSRSAAMTYAAEHIRVNAVDLGAFDTPMLRDAAATLGDPNAIRGAYLPHIPLQRLGDPEEAARAIVWLCSDEASYITAAAVAIDGGMMFAWPTGELEATNRE